MPPRHPVSERAQLDLFRALPGDLAPRDAQDLMAYPFFSLAKSKRLTPIAFKAGTVIIRVEAVSEHGMATIWDADILIWAASQIVEARDAGLKPSRLMAATPYEILTFIGRGVSLRDYDRLKAALDRLQSTTIATSIRQPTERRMHRFSWINEWKERVDAQPRAAFPLRRHRPREPDHARSHRLSRRLAAAPGRSAHRDRIGRHIDAIETAGIDPVEVSPDHWRHVHNRLAAGFDPRAYTPDRHRASLLRRRIEP